MLSQLIIHGGAQMETQECLDSSARAFIISFTAASLVALAVVRCVLW